MDFFTCGVFCVVSFAALVDKADNVELKSLYWVFLLIIAILFWVNVLVDNATKRIKKKRYLNCTLKKVDAMSGEEFEEFLKAHFEKLGYQVKLTPKSNDYGIDLICKRKIAVKNECQNGFVVQAKRYQGKVGVAAIQQVIAGAKYYDCKYGMVITNSYFTSNAWELAKKSGITLWDRNVLHEKFKIDED